jgi:hypothetical protein
VLSSQSNDDGGSRSQGDLRDDGRPATQRWTLEVKAEEDPCEEAFDAGTFAQFLSGPGRWETGAVLLAFGIPGDDRNGSQSPMDPGDELQAPLASIQADHARTELIKAYGPLQERTGKGRIMDIGGRDQEMDGQA